MVSQCAILQVFVCADMVNHGLSFKFSWCSKTIYIVVLYLLYGQQSHSNEMQYKQVQTTITQVHTTEQI